jgi:hypothetical protein
MIQLLSTVSFIFNLRHYIVERPTHTRLPPKHPAAAGSSGSSSFTNIKAAMSAKLSLRNMKLTAALRYHLALISRTKPPGGAPKGGGGVKDLKHVPYLGGDE